MRRTRSLLVGVVVALLLVTGTAYTFMATHGSSGAAHQLQILFPSADGLVSGSDVLEAGSKVGTISSVQPEGDSALVTIQVGDANWPLHQGLSADIRPKSLLGEKYVDLHDGSSKNAVFDANVVLHASNTADPVELDQFINSLDPATRTAIRVLLDDLGAGVAGRGPDLNAAIAAGRADLANLSVTGKTLNDRDPDLDRILVGLDGVLSRITTSDQLTQMSQLISNGQQVLDDIESVQGPFSKSFTDADAALTELNTAFDGAVPSLRSTLDQAPSLIGNLNTETSLLTNLAADVTGADGKYPDAYQQTICNPSNPPSPNVQMPAGLKPCSPLWMLIKGLAQGPTTSGGAVEVPAGRHDPTFRICLSNVPASLAGSAGQNGSCDGNASTTSGFAPGAYNNAALFAAFLGT